MRGRGWGRVAGVAAVVLAAGCAGSPQAPQPAPDLWPAGAQVELAATGMALFGGSSSGDLVVDGSGMAWADGAWQVSRIDPATGSATTWDAADDVAFASVQRLAPAQPKGVWLIDGATARLFDGERFAMTLTMPEGFSQDSQETAVAELLQVGDQVYVAGPAGVARWADGVWTPIGADQLIEVSALALDPSGALWAGGVLVGAPHGGFAVVRLDGDAWSEPDPAHAPCVDKAEISDLAADPGGGIWATCRAEATPQHGVFRYDGTAWRKVGDGGYADELGVTAAGEAWAMTSGGDGLWGSGTFIASRLAADGSWQPFTDEDGAPLADEGATADLAVAGDRVLMLHEEGLVALAGERFEPMWADPAAVLMPTFMMPADAVIARSAGEVWLPATPMPAPAGAETGGAAGAGLMRYEGGTWARVGPDVPGDTPVAPVQASDGAIWEVTRFGELVRLEGEAAAVLVPSDDYGSGGPLAPAARGAVWTIVDGEVVRVAPDGTRRSASAPEGGPLGPYTALAALGDERVWIDHEGVIQQWADGRWSDLPAGPGSDGMVAELLAAPDGALWALEGLDEFQTSTLMRYSAGAWQVGPSGSHGLVAGPEGTVCTIRRQQADIACYDAGLSVTRTIPVGAPVHAVGFAPDGAVWVVGEQVARIPPAG